MQFAISLWVAVVVVSMGCATPRPPAPVVIADTAPTAEQGEARPDAAGQAPFAFARALDLVERRCVVCHGCYDAPCQLKLDDDGGLQRGASRSLVYDATRLLAAEPSRLGIDAVTTAAWRDREFFTVLDGRARGRDGVLVRMLELKQAHPLPSGTLLPESFDLGINREQVCPNLEQMDEFEREHPSWGMPYALPSLTSDEHETLVAWARSGAPQPKSPPLPQHAVEQLERWEEFLNGDSLKARLMARYVYEHLFLATLSFGDDRDGARFRLVRSANPPGQVIAEIPTRRPFDEPGVPRVYYRLRRRHNTVVDKTHMPYVLDPKRMRRYTELFLEPKYDVAKLPSYAAEVASNPFVAFAAIPARSRYQFLLDEAQFTLMGFIKGPVCRGQIALDVIQDHFWIAFVDPSSPLLDEQDAFLRREKVHLDLPAGDGSSAGLANWLRYAHNQRNYLHALRGFLQSAAKRHGAPTIELLWDGDGSNRNAALTVFRHFDSATVVKGFQGPPPSTTWVLGYGVLERIHYLLVAGFDVYGNVGHQLTTRLYMDFLRMEAEQNFVAFLPRKRRQAKLDEWYRGVPLAVKLELYGRLETYDGETGVAYATGDAQGQLYARLQRHLGKLTSSAGTATQANLEGVRPALLERLSAVHGSAASLMPELSFVAIADETGGLEHFTFLRHSAHTNVAQLFREQSRRLPARDYASVHPGFIGAYPNALFVVADSDLDGFVRAVEALRTERQFRALMDRFGVRRTDARFWQHADALHAAHRKLEGAHAGLFDFSRIDNR